jgi:hypothetical protein
MPPDGEPSGLTRSGFVLTKIRNPRSTKWNTPAITSGSRLRLGSTAVASSNKKLLTDEMIGKRCCQRNLSCSTKPLDVSCLDWPRAESRGELGNHMRAIDERQVSRPQHRRDRQRRVEMGK